MFIEKPEPQVRNPGPARSSCVSLASQLTSLGRFRFLENDQMGLMIPKVCFGNKILWLMFMLSL